MIIKLDLSIIGISAIPNESDTTRSCLMMDHSCTICHKIWDCGCGEDCGEPTITSCGSCFWKNPPSNSYIARQQEKLT